MRKIPIQCFGDTFCGMVIPVQYPQKSVYVPQSNGRQVELVTDLVKITHIGTGSINLMGNHQDHSKELKEGDLVIVLGYRDAAGDLNTALGMHQKQMFKAMYGFTTEELELVRAFKHDNIMFKLTEPPTNIDGEEPIPVSDEVKA